MRILHENGNLLSEAELFRYLLEFYRENPNAVIDIRPILDHPRVTSEYLLWIYLRVPRSMIAPEQVQEVLSLLLADLTAFTAHEVAKILLTTDPTQENEEDIRTLGTLLATLMSQDLHTLVDRAPDRLFIQCPFLLEAARDFVASQ